MTDLTLYFLIPFVTGGIGFSTNWLGIKMMMYPTHRVGIGFIGWQGIIPRVRVRMTRAMVDSSISVVCTPQEMLEAVDDAKAIESITEIISPQIKDWADEFLKDRVSKLWSIAPSFVKRAVYTEIERQAPKFAEAVFEELKGRLSYLVDVGDIAAIESEKDPAIFPNLMLSIASKEFNFVIWSGLFIGIPLGCVQALVWYYYPNDFVLPLFGAFVGAFTNWLAIQALIHPSAPIKFFGFKIQGLFIARQQVVARDFADAFTNDFMEVNTVFEYIWNGENKAEVRGLVRRQLNEMMNERILTGPIYKALVLSGQAKSLDKETMNLIEDKVPLVLKHSSVTQKLLVPVRDLLADRMSRLSPKQFQGLLMPVFEEDQWLLIAVGGFLGFMVGTAQLVYIFGGNFLGG